MDFSNKTIAVGVTGGIAAYKAIELCSILKKCGADVFVVLTKNAKQFVTELPFETLTGNRTICDMFERDFEKSVKHISLANKADMFIIAPASANIIAKMACGIADDFLSTTLLAYKGPILIAPAMNTNMLQAKPTEKNISTLKKRGIHFIDSEEGMLACGVSGAGRLASIEDIAKTAYSILSPRQDFLGKTVLVTAGATRLMLDPVRYITNCSSGKMGIAIADEVERRGGSVIFVHGLVSESTNSKRYEKIFCDTTEEMYSVVMERFDEVDIFILAAAPVDYKTSLSSSKIKNASVTLQLEKTVDIAKAIGEKKKNKKLVIFAAETENLIKNATSKLKEKNADFVVANDVTKEGAGFSVDTNIVSVISKSSKKGYDKMQKKEVAKIILDTLLGKQKR